MILDLEEISHTVNVVTTSELYHMLSDFKKSFDSDITLGNIIDAVSIMMKIVARFDKIPGRDKKLVVIRLITVMIKEKGNFNNTFEDILIYVIPTTIDQLISVENGKMTFNKNPKCGCFAFRF